MSLAGNELGSDRNVRSKPHAHSDLAQCLSVNCAVEDQWFGSAVSASADSPLQAGMCQALFDHSRSGPERCVKAFRRMAADRCALGAIQAAGKFEDGFRWGVARKASRPPMSSSWGQGLPLVLCTMIESAESESARRMKCRMAFP